MIQIQEKTRESIEKASLSITQPKEGDFVQYSNTEFARISRIHQDGRFQISNKIGVCIWMDGTTMASGCTWDSDIVPPAEDLFLAELTPTQETKEGRCWTFDSKNNGVYFEIACKVWDLRPDVKAAEKRT